MSYISYDKLYYISYIGYELCKLYEHFWALLKPPTTDPPTHRTLNTYLPTWLFHSAEIPLFQTMFRKITW